MTSRVSDTYYSFRSVAMLQVESQGIVSERWPILHKLLTISTAVTHKTLILHIGDTCQRLESASNNRLKNHEIAVLRVMTALCS